MDDAQRILAIETSGRSGSVAALWGATDGSVLAGQMVLPAPQRTAQTLIPTIRQLFSMVGWRAESVDLVAVAVGPGSFTGLRIGVTAAKVLAYATGADVIAVDTLDAIAQQAPISAAPLWVVVDAQRQELFAARYVVDAAGSRHAEHQVRITSQETWLIGLRPGDYVTGPALGRLGSRLPIQVEVLPSELWQPGAEAVGRVAWTMYRAGRRDDIWQLVPNYCRASAAEEKRPI